MKKNRILKDFKYIKNMINNLNMYGIYIQNDYNNANKYIKSIDFHFSYYRFKSLFFKNFKNKKNYFITLSSSLKKFESKKINFFIKNYKNFKKDVININIKVNGILCYCYDCTLEELKDFEKNIIKRGNL